MWLGVGRVRLWVWVSAWVCAMGAGGRARELDPAACAARFDVQRDKIIRTEESREMGARYLSELDVGARRECLRLCCETDGCDVFVFEEKSPGSCYLFKCGPPEDFRCKFTSHSNFSSGVLALSRRLAELQDQERLVPLHHQLADLSKSRSPSTSAPSTPSAPPHPLAPSAPLHPPAPPDTQPAASRCSRYQFECRVGGECIAVYNACDGVPQCADGSDEAPELGCPPAPPAPPAATAPPAPVAAPAAPAPTASTPSPTPAPPPPPAIPQVRVETDMEDGGGLNAVEAVAEAAELWPHRLTQAQPQHHYNVGLSNVVMNSAGGIAGAPHIFSHKGGLVQELGEGAFEPPAPAPALAWPRHVWQTAQRHNGLSIGFGAENIGSNIGIDGAEGEWVPQQASGQAYWGDVPRARPVHRLAPSTQQQMQSIYGTGVESGNASGAGQGSEGGKTMPELPLYSGQPATLRDAPKKGFALTSVGAPAAPPPAAPPPPPAHAPASLENTTKKKVLKDNAVDVENTKNSAFHEEHRAVGQPASRGQPEQWASDDHDGLSEHPPAALLLLVLGALMTLALGTLAGCRLRAASRRRRHHKRYALDADYLVNGMYL